jgi:plasmid stabilization system protein ParE
MTTTGGFELHPEAAQDIPDIWEHIASENPMAARRVREDILQAIRDSVGRRNPGVMAAILRGREKGTRRS